MNSLLFLICIRLGTWNLGRNCWFRRLTLSLGPRAFSWESFASLVPATLSTSPSKNARSSRVSTEVKAVWSRSFDNFYSITATVSNKIWLSCNPWQYVGIRLSHCLLMFRTAHSCCHNQIALSECVVSHQFKQHQQLRPSFCRERRFCQHVCELLFRVQASPKSLHESLMCISSSGFVLCLFS